MILEPISDNCFFLLKTSTTANFVTTFVNPNVAISAYQPEGHVLFLTRLCKLHSGQVFFSMPELRSSLAGGLRGLAGLARHSSCLPRRVQSQTVRQAVADSQTGCSEGDVDACCTGFHSCRRLSTRKACAIKLARFEPVCVRA